MIDIFRFIPNIVIMKLSLAQINKVLENYDLWHAFSKKLLSSWYVNLNYKITTNTWDYVFRVFQRSDINDINYEVRVLNKLKESWFPAAYPVKRLDKNYICRADFWNVVIYNYVVGNEPIASPKVIKDIAKAVWKLHLIKQTHDLFHINKKKKVEYFDFTIDRIKSAKYQYWDLFEFYKQEADYFKQNLNKKLPVWIIHADIGTSNTIFLESKLMAILDFEEVHIWELLLDIWGVVAGFCFTKWNKISWNYVKIFIWEYEKIRKLTEDEKVMLPIYIELSIFYFLSTHLNWVLNEKNLKKEKRARYLMNRIIKLRKDFERYAD